LHFLVGFLRIALHTHWSSGVIVGLLPGFWLLMLLELINKYVFKALEAFHIDNFFYKP